MKKNSGKAPSEQFYYKDFAADMLEHAPDIVGAWTLVLVKIWHEKNGGQITKTIDQFALIMHTDITNARRFLDYFSSEKIADVTGDNGKITVINRRAKRDSKLREQNKIRQQRHRESDGKYGSNADVTVKKHHPSSSSSSSTSLKENNIKEKISFSVESARFENIDPEDMRNWAEAYPAVDINLAIKQAAQWLVSNPTKLKKNYKRFLTNWFSRTQEKGGNRNGKTQRGQQISSPKCFVCKGPTKSKLHNRSNVHICDCCRRLLDKAPTFTTRQGKTIPKQKLLLSQLEEMILKAKAEDRD